ncbi:MAG: hypothetical protein KJ606_05825 [Chloroflexi bacterium]|nr:hypothetical protein [Chloroflexota bacterium]
MKTEIRAQVEIVPPPFSYCLPRMFSRGENGGGRRGLAYLDGLPPTGTRQAQVSARRETLTDG